MAQPIRAAFRGAQNVDPLTPMAVQDVPSNTCPVKDVLMCRLQRHVIVALEIKLPFSLAKQVFDSEGSASRVVARAIDEIP